jgi:fatty acid-binding protein DegV
MRIGILVDATCDLPPSFIREHGIHLVPMPIKLGSAQIIDGRDPVQTADFYSHALGSRSALSVSVSPIDVDALRDYIVQHMSLRYDHILLVTKGASFSDTYRLARTATAEVARLSVAPRYEEKIKDLLQVTVIDSGNMYAGQGVQILKLVHLLNTGLEPDALRSAFNEVVACTTAFFVPASPKSIYAQAQNDFDPTATTTNTLLGYTFGSLLKLLPIVRVRHGASEIWHKVRNFEAGVEKVAELLVSAVEAKTVEPLLNVSFGGPTEELEGYVQYQQLRSRLQSLGVVIHESRMSIAAGIRLGPGALGFGVVATARQR